MVTLLRGVAKINHGEINNYHGSLTDGVGGTGARVTGVGGPAVSSPLGSWICGGALGADDSLLGTDSAESGRCPDGSDPGTELWLLVPERTEATAADNPDGAGDRGRDGPGLNDGRRLVMRDAAGAEGSRVASSSSKR